MDDSLWQVDRSEIATVVLNELRYAPILVP